MQDAWCATTCLATERLDAAVDVRVLFQAGRGGECFAALRARVRPRADVLRADVSLEVGRVGEDLLARLAHVATRLVVRDLVTDEIALPVVDFGTLVTLVLAFAAARVFGRLGAVVTGPTASTSESEKRAHATRRQKQMTMRR